MIHSISHPQNFHQQNLWGDSKRRRKQRSEQKWKWKHECDWM